jgi:mRNA (guanine-N7-)-methyltransferase
VDRMSLWSVVSVVEMKMKINEMETGQFRTACTAGSGQWVFLFQVFPLQVSTCSTTHPANRMSYYGYDDASRPKKRRVVVRRGGSSGGASASSRRRGFGDDNKVETNRVTKPGAEVRIPALPIAPTEKPVWMSDEQYEKTKQSIERAVGAVKGNGSDIAEAETQTQTQTMTPVGGTDMPTPMASEDVNVKIKYLKQLQAEGKDEIVRDFYNTQTFHSRQTKRTESPIYRLRSFNNCIKYILINKYGRPGGNVLELGCGKGGDLAKWEMIGTQLFVGVDLSDESVREAIKRYRQRRYGFGAVFATGDAFKTELPTILKDFSMEEVGGLQFDNVSMQFCMHYAFSSEESVLSMLKNVSMSLKVGGMFVGTIPSSDFIKWKLGKLKRDAGETGWGNELYRVTFPDLEGYDFERKQFKRPFGNVYNYFLKDAVEDVPEYVVPFEKFRGMCEEHGLELRYKKNFFDMFNKEVGPLFAQLPGPLVQSLRRADGTYGVDGAEREACSFYLAFAFERV